MQMVIFPPNRVLPPVPPGACIIWTHWAHNTLLLRGLVWVWCAHPREMVAVCFPILGRPCFSNDFYQRTVSNWFRKEKNPREMVQMMKTSYSRYPYEAKHGPPFTSLNLWCCLISAWKQGHDISLVSYLPSLGLYDTQRWLQCVRPVKTRTVLALKTWKFLISCRNDLSMLCLLNGILNCPLLPARAPLCNCAM